MEDYAAVEKIQNRNWQYLIELLIVRVEDDSREFQAKTNKESTLLKKIKNNSRTSRRVYDSTYQFIADNVLPYLNSLNFDEKTNSAMT